MLILNRKLGESIMIGDDIEIVVTGIRSHMVKLGFIAGKHVKVLRKELWLHVPTDNGCSICNDPKCDNPGGKH